MSAFKKSLLAGLYFRHPIRRQYLKAPIQDRMQKHLIPGIAAVVIDEGTIVDSYYIGEKERGSGRLINEETMFLAGSISKSVTGYMALKLLEEEILDLDKPINTILKSWDKNQYISSETYPHITIRQLLSHRAGVNVHGFHGYPQKVKVPSAMDVINGRGNSDPIGPIILPELNFRYSGGGTTLFQVYLEYTTGKSFEDLAKKFVFDPLHMKNSTFEQPITDIYSNQIATGHTSMYGEILPGKYHTYPEKAAAGLWTTASDLARVFIDIQDAYHIADGYLSQKSAKLIFEHPKDWDYHLGFGISNDEGVKRFGHSGWDEGFVSSATFFQETRQGMVVLTNKDWGSTEFISEFMHTACRTYKLHNWMRDYNPDKSYPSELLELLTGKYIVNDKPVEIRMSDAKIAFEFNNHPPFLIYYDKILETEGETIKHRLFSIDFHLDILLVIEENNPPSVILTQNGQNFELEPENTT